MKFPFPKPEIPEIAAKLEPGDHGKKADGREKAPSELMPVGKADGVIYLGAITKIEMHDDNPDEIWEETKLENSAEREALTYLKAMPDSFYVHHQNMRTGTCKPYGIESIFPKEIEQAAKETRRPIEWLFTSDERGINAVQKKKYWRVYRVKSDVWVVVFVNPDVLAARLAKKEAAAKEKNK